MDSKNSSGQNTGVVSLSLLQGTFPTRSPALQADSLPTEPPGKPLILDTISTPTLNHKLIFLVKPAPAPSLLSVAHQQKEGEEGREEEGFDGRGEKR